MFGQPESKHHLKPRGTTYFTKPTIRGVGVITYTLLSGGVSPFWGGNRYRTMAKVVCFNYRFIFSYLFIFSFLFFLIFYHLFLFTLILSYLILSFSTLVKILLIVHLYRPSLVTTPWTFPTSSTCPTRGKTSSRSCWCSTPPRGTQRPRPYNTPGCQTTGYILFF